MGSPSHWPGVLVWEVEGEWRSLLGPVQEDELVGEVAAGEPSEEKEAHTGWVCVGFVVSQRGLAPRAGCKQPVLAWWT